MVVIMTVFALLGVLFLLWKDLGKEEEIKKLKDRVTQLEQREKKKGGS